MLAVIRLVLIALFIITTSIIGLIICILIPFHPNHVNRAGRLYSQMAKLLGVKLVIKNQPDIEVDANGEPKSAVYVANHQNSYDIFTICGAVPRRTVSIGKKSLKWIPFFGQLYWFTGNILIDRANKSKAVNTIGKTAEKIREKQLSVWMFPEGTRSYGRGLLPFKTGAFHTALLADVPVVPVCMSTTHNKIELNRWDNGTVYVEFLPPVTVTKERPIREQANEVHAMMDKKIKQLDLIAE